MSRVDARFVFKFWKQESFSGNGSTTVFTLATTPEEDDSVLVMLDGLGLTRTTHYTISGAAITMSTAPANAQKLLVYYIERTGGT